MKLIDENGQEWEQWPGAVIDSSVEGIIVVKKKPKPKVIDWSKVHLDVPVIHRQSGSRQPVYIVEGRSAAYYPERGYVLESGKWVVWFGGECPLPDGVVVEVAYRGKPPYRHHDLATDFMWRHQGDSGDIIAFRVTGLADGYCYSEEGWRKEL